MTYYEINLIAKIIIRLTNLVPTEMFQKVKIFVCLDVNG